MLHAFNSVIPARQSLQKRVANAKGQAPGPSIVGPRDEEGMEGDRTGTAPVVAPPGDRGQ